MARSSAALKHQPLAPSRTAGSAVESEPHNSGLLDTSVGRERRRGRGTASNASGRYEPIARIAFDDGWQSLDDLPPFKTTVQVDATRKIITRNESPDIS